MSERQVWGGCLAATLLMSGLAAWAGTLPGRQHALLEQRAGDLHRQALAGEQRLQQLRRELPGWRHQAARSSTDLRLRLEEELQLWRQLGRFESLSWDLQGHLLDDATPGWEKTGLELQISSTARTVEPALILLEKLRTWAAPHPADMRGCRAHKAADALWHTDCLMQLWHQSVPELPELDHAVPDPGAEAFARTVLSSKHHSASGRHLPFVSGAESGALFSDAIAGNASPARDDDATRPAAAPRVRSPARSEPALILQAIIQGKAGPLWLVDGVWIEPAALGLQPTELDQGSGDRSDTGVVRWVDPVGRVQMRLVGESLRGST